MSTHRPLAPAGSSVPSSELPGEQPALDPGVAGVAAQSLPRLDDRPVPAVTQETRLTWRQRLSRWDVRFSPYLYVAPFFVLFLLVGMFPLPTRHGMTACELARWFARYYKDVHKLDCNLQVVAMKGWRRSMWWGDTGLPWVIPSPNMPTVYTATVYPGMCLVEGTNLSEGRGTTHPFEFFGAPWLDSFQFASQLNKLGLPGVRFRPHYFTPMFHKHEKQVCGGVELHVTNRATFEPYRTGLWCGKVARDMNTELFKWRTETYEFVSDRLAIDLLAGTSKYREFVESGGDVDEWVKEWEDPLHDFARLRDEFLLYRE